MDVSQSLASFSSPFSLSLKLSQQQQQQYRSQQKQQAIDPFSFSPDALYNYSPDEYSAFAGNTGYGTDYSAESPLSLGSPVSPVTTAAHNPYIYSGVSSHADLDPWAKLDASPADLDLDLGADDFAFVKSEPGVTDSPLLFATAAFPPLTAAAARALSVSPAINPVELSNHMDNDVDAFAAPISPNTTSTNMPASRDQRRQSARKASASNNNTTSTKRKSSSARSSAKEERSPKSPKREDSTCSLPPKKTAHNLIEKRYRTNLNDKILALRDSVPSLRVVVRQSDGGEGEEDLEIEDGNENVCLPESAGDDLGGLAPAHKLNKATILSKATEYIAHLERRNSALLHENQQLRTKCDGYEVMVMSRGSGPNGVWC